MSRYAYGYCGMPCALCTRCRTEGSSRCPGCSCDGYYTVPCKVHRCVREKGLDHCGQCGEFPCPKLGKMGDFRDLDTGRVKERTCRAVAAEGLGDGDDLLRGLPGAVDHLRRSLAKGTVMVHLGEAQVLKGL